MAFERLSRSELATLLEKLLAQVGSDGKREPAREARLLYELQVHQVELEMQNRELRDAHSTLEISRDQYVELYDLAPVAYLTFDEKGVVRKANLTAAAMLGRAREMLIGMPFVSLVRLVHVNDLFELLRECAEQRAKIERALSFFVAGRLVHVEAACVPALDERGRPTTFRVAFTDVTRRQIAEEERESAHESERRLRARLDALLDASFAVSRELANDVERDTHQLYSLIAEQAARVAAADHGSIELETGESAVGGRSQEGEKSRGSRAVVPICVRGRCSGTLSVTRASGGEFTADELRMLETFAEHATSVLETRRLARLAARERSRLSLLERVSARLTSVRDVESSISALRQVAKDVVPELGDGCAAHLLVQQELRTVVVAHRGSEKQALLERALGELRVARDHPTSVFARVMREGKAFIEQASPRSLGLHQPDHLDAPEGLGIERVHALPLIVRDRLLGALSLLLEPGREFDGAYAAWAEEVAMRCAFALDTAKLIEELRAAASTRDELLALVSHDLRSPLNAISLSANALDPLPSLSERRSSHKQVDLIKRSALRMDHLIGDLLMAGNIENGRFSVEPRPEPASELVLEACQAAEPGAAAKSLTVEQRLGSELPLVLADRSRVLQVLANLIGNAMKFAPEGSAIQVGAALRPPGEVEFFVSDAGPGIGIPQIAHVFERYWTGKTEPSREQKKKSHGFGLGLFIAKGIVDAHGGRIWVDSQPGQGATFGFTLPALLG